ncbi:hypothetical protein [Stappia sp. P2PMeth1]|uniref:hypothetical protein n=1 Tax=Stappia sp. P2PMeth1 TaxID=2003586 RepID=UPI0016483125|nr:hypothetical protein [Stappia sp. P2PMeth1]
MTSKAVRSEQDEDRAAGMTTNAIEQQKNLFLVVKFPSKSTFLAENEVLLALDIYRKL